jgi:hypothetical protein
MACIDFRLCPRHVIWRHDISDLHLHLFRAWLADGVGAAGVLRLCPLTRITTTATIHHLHKPTHARTLLPAPIHYLPVTPRCPPVRPPSISGASTRRCPSCGACKRCSPNAPCGRASRCSVRCVRARVCPDALIAFKLFRPVCSHSKQHLGKTITTGFGSSIHDIFYFHETKLKHSVSLNACILAPSLSLSLSDIGAQRSVCRRRNRTDAAPRGRLHVQVSARTVAKMLCAARVCERRTGEMRQNAALSVCVFNTIDLNLCV